MVMNFSITFSGNISKRFHYLSKRFESIEQRNKVLYLVCFIVCIIIITVIIVYFSCFYDKFNDNEIYDKLNTECLKSHNYYRSLHGVQALKLDPKVSYNMNCIE